VFTAVALGLPLGQIVGRFGNWFNQELYGRPTDLPWGLEIDPEHRLAGYEGSELFHPTFAYEILWNIALLGLLLWIDRKRVLKPGALFAVYLIGYGIGRILIELVRIDPVNELIGIRLHIWAMVAFIAGAAVYLHRNGWASEPALATAEASEAEAGESAEAGEAGTGETKDEADTGETDTDTDETGPYETGDAEAGPAGDGGETDIAVEEIDTSARTGPAGG
jgi:hypothetical protein